MANMQNKSLKKLQIDTIRPEKPDEKQSDNWPPSRLDSGKWRRRRRWRPDVVVALLLSLFVFVESASVDDCHGVRYAYRERGLDLVNVPRQPRQGKKRPRASQVKSSIVLIDYLINDLFKLLLMRKCWELYLKMS